MFINFYMRASPKVHHNGDATLHRTITHPTHLLLSAALFLRATSTSPQQEPWLVGRMNSRDLLGGIW